MNPYKVHAIVEQIRQDPEVVFDYMDLIEEGVDGILKAANVFTKIEPDEEGILFRDLADIAEQRQTSEIARLALDNNPAEL